MNTTNKNPAAWTRNLYEAGSIKNNIARAEEIMAELARAEEMVRAHKRNLRSLAKRVDAEAIECGWSAEQIAAAKAGDCLATNGARWKVGA